MVDPGSGKTAPTISWSLQTHLHLNLLDFNERSKSCSKELQIIRTNLSSNIWISAVTCLFNSYTETGPQMPNMDYTGQLILTDSNFFPKARGRVSLFALIKKILFFSHTDLFSSRFLITGDIHPYTLNLLLEIIWEGLLWWSLPSEKLRWFPLKFKGIVMDLSINV